MPAALLRNNSKCNALEDNREPGLHVLTWTALRFSKHALSEGDSSAFLRAFDEEYETADGTKGGDLKKGFLRKKDLGKKEKDGKRAGGREDNDEIAYNGKESYSTLQDALNNTLGDMGSEISSPTLKNQHDHQ